LSPQTVWLASYPKSGNTWVRALLTGLLLEEDEVDINQLGHGPIASFRGYVERYTGLVSSDLTQTEIATLRPAVDLAFDAKHTRTRYRKVHDTLFSGPEGAPIVSPEATLGAVYIVRDPRDVAVSFAHYAGMDAEWATDRIGSQQTGLRTNLEDIGPQVPQRLGTWSDHVRSWTEQTLFPVIVVRYEDLHTDPGGQLERIAQFGKLEATPEAIAAAVEAASFERASRQEAQEGFRERGGVEQRFFRRGLAGGWKDELPVELAERIVTDHREVMQRLGYI
jgi:aryl sulfotransferase